jgi:hypothetical protein
MHHLQLKYRSDLQSNVILTGKVLVLLMLISSVLSGAAFAQSRQTKKYIQKYRSTIPECYKNYIPKEFYLSNFLDEYKVGKLVLHYYPKETDPDYRSSGTYFDIKLDTQVLYIFNKRVLKETWDYALNTDISKGKYRIINSKYSFDSSEDSLSVTIVTSDPLKKQPLITKLIYKKDLLSRIEVSRQVDTNLVVDIKYKEEFKNNARIDGLLPLPFDTVAVDLLLPSTKCEGYKFTFYSWRGNRSAYRSESKYNDCFYKHGHLINDLKNSGRTTPDVFSFFLVGRVFDRIMIYQEPDGCSIEIIKN